MLPTKGLFREILCPYNESPCDRPFCHFKHSKLSRKESNQKFSVGAKKKVWEQADIFLQKGKETVSYSVNNTEKNAECEAYPRTENRDSSKKQTEPAEVENFDDAPEKHLNSGNDRDASGKCKDKNDCEIVKEHPKPEHVQNALNKHSNDRQKHSKDEHVREEFKKRLKDEKNRVPSKKHSKHGKGSKASKTHKKDHKKNSTTSRRHSKDEHKNHESSKKQSKNENASSFSGKSVENDDVDLAVVYEPKVETEETKSTWTLVETNNERNENLAESHCPKKRRVSHSAEKSAEAAVLRTKVVKKKIDLIRPSERISKMLEEAKPPPQNENQIDHPVHMITPEFQNSKIEFRKNENSTRPRITPVYNYQAMMEAKKAMFSSRKHC